MEFVSEAAVILLQWSGIAILFIGLYFTIVNGLPALVYAVLGRIRLQNGEKKLTDRQLLLYLRRLPVLEFEAYVADLFTRMGFSASSTGSAPTGSVEVEAVKDGVRHYIQYKKVKTKRVGFWVLKNFYAAIAHRLAYGKHYVISTKLFTSVAEQFAANNNVELIDGTRLLEYIKSVAPTQPGDPVATRPGIDHLTPLCIRCGSHLVVGLSETGQFFGCSRFPCCMFTEMNTTN